MARKEEKFDGICMVSKTSNHFQAFEKDEFVETAGLKESWMKDSHASKQGYRKGFSKTDHIHAVSKLIEVSREYKMPLCLTFIDLKTFDSAETEAVVEALDNQGVPTRT
ncbi:hypothetical protein RB195_008939 [Necator americanus]|uniref:Uncharacterized protein n=1 Tax=Necator americanus TaxID=51031 RepID=A0ABR1CS88_NECAM